MQARRDVTAAPSPGRRAWAALRQMLRSAAAWALGSSLTTAVLAAAGRALCLPPYWPPSVAFRCRSDTIPAAVVRAPLDTLVTTLMLFVPALLLGAGLHVVVRTVRHRSLPAARLVGAVLAAALWVLLARGLEPSHLDFILGGYAIGAGAVVGVLIVDRVVVRGG